MKIGKLRHKASIEAYTEAVNSFGEAIKTWVKVSDIWCSIKPLNGNEKYVSAEKHATATHQCITRFIDGIDPKMRVVYGTRIFEITAPMNVNEESKMLQLILEEQADV